MPLTCSDCPKLCCSLIIPVSFLNFRIPPILGAPLFKLRYMYKIWLATGKGRHDEGVENRKWLKSQKSEISLNFRKLEFQPAPGWPSGREAV